jgi:hypothetical protein
MLADIEIACSEIFLLSNGFSGAHDFCSNNSDVFHNFSLSLYRRAAVDTEKLRQCKYRLTTKVTISCSVLHVYLYILASKCFTEKIVVIVSEKARLKSSMGPVL